MACNLALALFLTASLAFAGAGAQTTITAQVCQQNSLLLGVCVQLAQQLSLVQPTLAATTTTGACCTLFGSFLQVNAAACACTVVQLPLPSLSGASLTFSANISFFLNACGITPPPNLQCVLPGPTPAPAPAPVALPPSPAPVPAAIISPPPPSPPPPTTPIQCPMNSIQISLCASSLGALPGLPIIGGLLPLQGSSPCCSTLRGIPSVQAAVCVCLALNSVTSILPIALRISFTSVFSTCGLGQPPAGFVCQS